MGSKADYLWLRDFWQKLIAPRPGRRWEVAFLIDGDLALRDGVAYGLIREQLHGRRDVACRYVRAWEIDDDESELGENVDFLLIGRPRLFTSPRFAPLAGRLEGNAYGRFSDRNAGRIGVAVTYGKRSFKRHEMEEQAEEYRRYDQDYGILLCRRENIKGEERHLVAIAGLGILGTLGLSVILTDERRRHELTRQVQEIAPLTERHLPERHIEIGVRITVDGHKQLVSLLNNLSRGEPAFTFQTEVVAVETTDGKSDIRFLAFAEMPIELRTLEADLRHRPKCLALLRAILHEPDTATPNNLCLKLGFISKGRKSPPSDQERTRLAKLIHDLNTHLKGHTKDQHSRMIRFDKKRNTYVIQEMIRL